MSKLPPVHAGPGPFPPPFVQAGDGQRSLFFTIDAVQSRVDLKRPGRLELEYTRLMAAFLQLQATPEVIGMVGLGGGALARFCHAQLPRACVWVAEINPHVIALRSDFDVPEDSERFQVVRADGADFVRCIEGRLDTLLVDGYEVEGLPRSLSGQRFFDDCATALRPGGVLVMNLWAEASRKAQVLERIRRSFDGAMLAVDCSARVNTVVFAVRGPALQTLPSQAPRRPEGMDAAVWTSLQAAFAQVLAAWRLEFA